MAGTNKRLHLEEKLAALRESDHFRKWYSLDDRRVCVLCERLINGRMIEVWRDGNGTCRLHCPTPGCPAGPRDWFYHGSAERRKGRVVRSSAARIFASPAAA